MDNFYNDLDNIKKYLKKDHIDNYDIENEIFDINYNKDLEIDENGFFITRGNWYKKLSDGPEVIYKLNPMGFRSREFKKLESNKNNILFAGCSFTFGEGLPEEYTWTKMLTNKMCNRYSDVVDYNIAFPGESIFTIIKNTYAFINKYGSPKFLFMCLPPITRYISYSDKLCRYSNIYLLRDIKITDSNDPQKEYTKNYKYQNNILIYNLLIHFFEDYCKNNNINLFWTTWDEHDGELYAISNFNNFIELDFFVPKQPKIENIDNFPYWQLAEDLGHPGTKWSKMICDKMFMEVTKNEKNNS